MSRKRITWIIVILLIAGGAGGYWFYRQSSTPAQAATEPAVQTSVVRRGSLIISATGAGSVIPAQELTLSFAGSGTLTELNVQVGDHVSEGDVLARIDDSDAQQALVNAQLQLDQAKMQTDASATQVGVSYDDISIAQAQMNLDQAQTSLDELLNWTPDADAIALAQARLDAAQAAYNAARGQAAASSNNITVQSYTVQNAEQAVADAQAAYDTAWDPARDWELNDPRRADALERERDQTTDALEKAQQNLEIARLNYNSTVSSTSQSGTVSAQTNLLSAQQDLAAAQTGPTTDEINTAQQAVRQAELALQQTRLNAEANQLKLAQAQLNVTAAQQTLDGTVLTAPMAGTVMQVNAAVGENAGSGVIVLADLEQPLLEIYLDESDMNMAGLDYEVDVTFDALPDDTFVGHIIQIDPQLASSNGVTTLRALVLLDADSFAKPQTLPVGLNATVEVIGGRADNALLVPVEALRELSPGQYAVFVMENGEPKLHTVEVGLMDFTFAQILSGLNEGDVVTTGIVQTN
ncbi:MAG: efflux RND transporter periplasmic adaptor subunit [Ardenticatenales bacterium]|nr:efflux RND transporter periplasmic adaptor subunit [Ardenticatenales bacterium]